MIEQFKELYDRYEKEFELDSGCVLVSLDKDELSEDAELILDYVVKNIEKIINESLSYINENKSDYKIEEIDDFSDPGIFIGSDNFSVFWDSEKGEEKGVSVIGADYYWPQRKWLGLTLAD